VNWLLFIVGLIALLLSSLVVVELASRWWLRRKERYYVWPPNLRLGYHPDPQVFPELERKVRFYINGDGERGGPLPRAHNGVYRTSSPPGEVRWSAPCWTSRPAGRGRWKPF
jgi:hypothetical protein